MTNQERIDQITYLAGQLAESGVPLWKYDSDMAEEMRKRLVVERRAEELELLIAKRSGEEVGWLIERSVNIQTQYLWKHDGLSFQWTTTVNRAMRFARREDADNLCGLFECEDIHITEHCMDYIGIDPMNYADPPRFCASCEALKAFLEKERADLRDTCLKLDDAMVKIGVLEQKVERLSAEVADEEWVNASKLHRKSIICRAAFNRLIAARAKEQP